MGLSQLCWTVKFVEVNKKAKCVFGRPLLRLPASVNSESSWHCGDVSVVSRYAFLVLFHKSYYDFEFLRPVGHAKQLKAVGLPHK